MYLIVSLCGALWNLWVFLFKRAEDDLLKAILKEKRLHESSQIKMQPFYKWIGFIWRSAVLPARRSSNPLSAYLLL